MRVPGSGHQSRADSFIRSSSGRSTRSSIARNFEMIPKHDTALLNDMRGPFDTEKGAPMWHGPDGGRA